MNLEKLQKASQLLEMLDNGISKLIVNYLVANPQGKTVTELFIKFRCDRTVMSRKLSELKSHELVKDQRKGRNIIYTACNEKVNNIQNSISKFLRS